MMKLVKEEWMPFTRVVRLGMDRKKSSWFFLLRLSSFLLSNCDIFKLGFYANRIKSNTAWFRIMMPEKVKNIGGSAIAVLSILQVGVLYLKHEMKAPET